MSAGRSSSIGHLDLNAIKRINALSAKEKYKNILKFVSIQFYLYHPSAKAFSQLVDTPGQI